MLNHISPEVKQLAREIFIAIVSKENVADLNAQQFEKISKASLEAAKAFNTETETYRAEG